MATAVADVVNVRVGKIKCTNQQSVSLGAKKGDVAKSIEFLWLVVTDVDVVIHRWIDTAWFVRNRPISVQYDVAVN